MDYLLINNGIEIPHSEFEFTASRSSGPGGQHVNKTSSKILLRWNIFSSSSLSGEQKQILLKNLKHRLINQEEVLIQVDSSRSQHANKAEALKKLREIIIVGLKKQKKRLATKASKAQKQARLADKKHRSLLKRLRKFPKID